MSRAMDRVVSGVCVLGIFMGLSGCGDKSTGSMQDASMDASVVDGSEEADAAQDAVIWQDAMADSAPLGCPEDNLVDLEVGSLNGEQIVPKVALSRTGRAWISFYSNEGTNYDVRLQHMDLDGARLMGASGMLVSDHTSDTWVTSHSIASDSTSSAILAFNDIRDGNFDTVAYKISPEGDFLWGNDGVMLSSDPEDDLYPKMAVTQQDNVVFTWERLGASTRVVVQRLSSGGNVEWADGVVILGASGEALRPWIVPAEGESVIVVWIDTPDSMSYDRTILARKLNADGDPVWANDAVVVDTHEIPFFYDPVLEPDGNGGVFVSWIAIVNTLSKSFVQHIDADGSPTMPADGVPFSTSSSTHQFDPKLACISSAQELVVAWRESDINQSEMGLYAQRFTLTGDRGWPDTGLVLEEMEDPGILTIAAGSAQGGAVIMYVRRPVVFTETQVMGGLLALEEAPAWEPIELSSPSEQGHLNASGDPSCGYWVVWEDLTSDPGDIRGSFFVLP